MSEPTVIIVHRSLAERLVGTFADLFVLTAFVAFGKWMDSLLLQIMGAGLWIFILISSSILFNQKVRAKLSIDGARAKLDEIEAAHRKGGAS